MNRNRKIVLSLTAASVAFLLLFPPFDQTSLANSRVPAFAGFYLYFMPPAYGIVNVSLLVLEQCVVLVNAAFAWLLLRDKTAALVAAPRRGNRLENAVLVFSGINLLLVMLFPPLESVFALTNAALPSFEGFYFIFHKRPDHTVVTTLLYLEVIFILINTGIAWLIFRRAGPRALTPDEARELALRIRSGMR